MLSSPSAAGRLLIAASLLAFALTACGRRGPLEPPPNPAAVAAQKQRDEQRRERQRGARTEQAPAVEGATAVETKIPPLAQTSRVEGENPPPDDDEDDNNGLPSIIPAPAPKPNTARKRGYVIPKEPFILDPLL
jgi:predicted small lipoprotein YifL